MTVGTPAVQAALVTLVESLTVLEVWGEVVDETPHVRVETSNEPEYGRNKDGSASAVTSRVTVFSKSLSEAQSEIKTITDGIDETTLQPAGFSVMGLEKIVRRIPGSDRPDDRVHGMQCELETIIEPI